MLILKTVRRLKNKRTILRPTKALLLLMLSILCASATFADQPLFISVDPFVFINPEPRAKICEYGDPACNRCVVDTVGQLGAGDFLERASAKTSYKFPLDITWGSVRLKNSPHVQGVARLPDWNGQGRMIMSENATGSGLNIALQDIEGASEAAHSSSTTLKDRRSFDIRGRVPLGDYAHPGGLQNQGNIIAIAMEQGHGPAAVYFVIASGSSLSYSNKLLLDGSRGEPGQHVSVKGGAATTGLLKLSDDRYLVAVSGRRHGTEGIWFYRSDTPAISSRTNWDYLGMYTSDCIGYDPAVSQGCYTGAGGGLSLVADCTGDIFMLGMTARTANDELDLDRDNEYLQVFKLEFENGGHLISAELVHQLTADHGSPTTGRPSFRWAGGSYVDRDGKLLIFNSRRTTSTGVAGGMVAPWRGEKVEGDVFFAGE